MPSSRRRWRREVRSCLYGGKSSMRSPRLRAVLAAVHRGRCTRFALPHASSITRESPSVVARFLPMFESKVLRRPAANYALMLRSCNGSRQHFLNCCVRATSTEAQRQLGLDAALARSMGSEEGTDASLCVFRPRARSNRPPPLSYPALCAIAHWGGGSSTPQLLDGLRTSLEYWITRLVGDDGPVRIVAVRPPEAAVARPGCRSRPGSPSALQNSV